MTANKKRLHGNPTDLQATNFGTPAALFEKFPPNAVFVFSKDGPRACRTRRNRHDRHFAEGNARG
jgi:hypothetical protein